MILIEHLRDLGFRTEEAANAREAINIARATNVRVHAAIIDVELPDLTGDILADELRAIDPKLPLIVASGYGEPREKFPHGGVVFLAKPYEMSGIERALAQSGLHKPQAKI